MVVHADKLRWLFWLRWKTFIRNYTRSSGRVGRIIGVVFLILLGLPFMGGIAVVTFFGYRLLPTPANAEILFLVLTGVYLLWIVLPLLEFTVNEGLDISKLALFPLTRAELMLSLIFTSLLDVPTIGLLIVLGAVVAGWAVSLPLALMAFLTMVVFYAQVIGISQLVLALLARVLQSRRFRDLSIILIGVFSSSCYLFQQFVLRGIGVVHIYDNLKAGTISPYLQWLPPGMAARAIQRAASGDWGISFVWLGGLLATTVLVLYLWQLVVERGLTASESGSSSVRRRRTQQTLTPVAATSALASTGLVERIVASQFFSIAVKDIKYYRRDPQLLRLIFQSFISMFVLIAVTLFNTSGSGRLVIGSWAVMVAPLYALFALTSFSYNVLGMERQSLTSLFLFPVNPKQVLWGKNVVTFLIGLIEVLVLVLVSAFVGNGWDLVLPALAIGIAGIGIILGCGNFSSIFFPQRMPQGRRGFQTNTSVSSEGGCLRAVMSLTVLTVMAILLIPVAAGLVLPVWYHAQWIWVLTVPTSLLYSAVFYVIVTNLVAPRMLTRTPEILAVVTRE
ncbi:MAG: hypothetical protein NVSMB49_03580 [Ktedonobacteraceae bacterium]